MSRLRDSLNLAACLLVLVGGLVSSTVGLHDALPLFICAMTLGLFVLGFTLIEKSGGGQ
jgi:hypothetical protein